MHELAVCQALLEQVTEVAKENSASKVTEITVLLGPLSGVEAPLLLRAFMIARMGTVAATAQLTIDSEPLTIRCRSCRLESQTTVNRLRCSSCGQPYPQLISGDSLILSNIAVERDPVNTLTMQGVNHV